MYIHFNAHAYPHYRIRVFTLLNTYIHFTEYVHLHYRTRIFVPHFVGVFVYAGTINRPLQLLVVCHFVANGLLIMQRSPTKLVANTPPGVGGPIHRARILILSNTYIHVINYVFPFQRTHISTLPNTCIHIIEYVYSFHRIRAFALPHTHIHIIAHAYSSPISWVFSYMRAR